MLSTLKEKAESLGPPRTVGSLERMRIAFAMIHCNRRDGSARAVNEVAERLGKKHQVHLFARKAEDLDLSLVHWRRMPCFGWPAFAAFSSYHLLAEVRIRSRDFDIIHSIGNNAMAANVITIQNIQPAKRKYLDQAISNERTSLVRRLTRRWFLDITTAVEHRVYAARPGKRLPLFLPVSKGVERELRKHYDIGAAPVRIIPNAADTSLFRPLPPDFRTKWRAANGIREKDFACLFSGGEWHRKGLDLAIRAIALLTNCNLKLFVAGEDADRSHFVGLVAELGLGERVIFGGFQRDIATAMGACDLFLFPSWYEAFSLATIEAAACGLPIVASRINGAEDFIQPGVNGEFIDHDPDHIASVLRPLISDLALCRRLGESGRRLVEERYTWDRVARMTEEAYMEYLGS